MASQFLLQIVDKVTGQVVSIEPGLSVEINFVDDCVNRISAQGIGLLVPMTTVQQRVRKGIEAAIYALKAQI